MDKRSPLNIVTTSLRPNREQKKLAAAIAARLGIPAVERGKRSLNNLLNFYNAGGAVVVKAGTVSYHCRNRRGEFFFHPDKSVLRIKEIKAGKTDQMIKAMDLYPGYSIIDCTLGMATDAIVASYIVGNRGQVVGIESSPIIALLVELGLQNYRDVPDDVAAAMRRIKVICDDNHHYLARLKQGSFDVVYFDPMFREPKRGNGSAIEQIRPLAGHEPLARATIKRALYVAKRRVVVKEARKSGEFDRLGADQVAGGKHSPVQYGIWFKKGGLVFEQ